MPNDSPYTQRCEQSVAMLKAVIAGSTYQSVAAEFGVSRSAVERRIKEVAARLIETVGIEGLRVESTLFVQRLRQSQVAIMQALSGFTPMKPSRAASNRLLTREEVHQGAARIRTRSSRPNHDLALYYLVFSTGAWSLEIARLKVCDYLKMDGSVRRVSRMPAQVANNGRERPLYFCCERFNAVMADYLQERIDLGMGVTNTLEYRGLVPDGPLFVMKQGGGFKITQEKGQVRWLCRPIHNNFRQIFHCAGLEGMNPQLARKTVISMLYARGADEHQVGVLLGIADSRAVRALLPRPKPGLEEIVGDLI